MAWKKKRTGDHEKNLRTTAQGVHLPPLRQGREFLLRAPREEMRWAVQRIPAGGAEMRQTQSAGGNP